MSTETTFDDELNADITDVTPQTGTKTKSSKASSQKWGDKVIDLGFCVVPSLIFRAQRRLGLNPTQLAILLQIADFWWDAGRKPFPKKSDLADRLGLSDRQIQRHIAELETAGFLTRIERTLPRRGKVSNEYDLQGLVKKLQELAPEFLEVAETAKAQRKAVSQPGYRRRKTTPTEIQAG